MSRRGYSLIELLMVMTIVGVVAAIAAPRYGNAASRYAAESAAHRIAADLEQARELAKGASTSYVVSFKTGAGAYEFGPAGTDASSPFFQVVRVDREPYGVTIESADFASTKVLTFNGYGVPDAGGSVLITKGSRSYRVSVAANSGKCTVQLVN